MRRVSNKRQRLNRIRRKNLVMAFGHEPMCVFPGCSRRADDAHEILSRARGGSITDPANIAPLCRSHHDYITTNPLVAEAMGLSRSDIAS